VRKCGHDKCDNGDRIKAFNRPSLKGITGSLPSEAEGEGKMKKLLAVCGNCGQRRYKQCGCQLPDPKSKTQKKKRNRSPSVKGVEE
jgi:hypothetical protein